MRLRTKILLICCIGILCSSIFSSVLVYQRVKSSALDVAEGESLKNAMVQFQALQDKMRVLDNSVGTLDEKVLEYVFKQQGDDMLVCFYTDKNEEVFNNTVFSQADFETLQYESISNMNIQVAKMQWEGRHLLVYVQLGIVHGCSTYKLEDITYVWERMRILGIGLILLTCIVTGVVCLMIFLVLKKVLKPLQNLNAGAKQIARGNYDERIAVHRKDEIGELSENFNQMADAVQLQIEKLEEAQWKRTLFMGNLTHELKTPMTAISGYAKTLLTVKLPEEDKEEALSYIYEESCRLERLSRKMMNLLMLEKDDDQINLVEVSANVLFHNAKEACSRSLEEDGIDLECRENGETFLVDADLFTEVLINLIDNGRKASSRGDKIVLSATEQVIEVRDFGKGIPEEEKEKILEPFYMIDKSRSRKSGGAGLGLAITAMILKRHNCEIEIESEVGKGTRMILQFV